MYREGEDQVGERKVDFAVLDLISPKKAGQTEKNTQEVVKPIV